MKKQKTKSKTKSKNKSIELKSKKSLVVASCIVGACAIAVSIVYQDNDQAQFEEMVHQEADMNFELVDVQENSLNIVSDSVDESKLVCLAEPTIAQAYTNSEEIAFQEALKIQLVSNDTNLSEIKSQEPVSYKEPEEQFSSLFQVGADYTHVNLKPQGNPSFHGNLGGLQASYEYKPKNNLYAGVEFSWKEGNTHGSSGKRSLLYIDAQERFGYTVATKNLGFSFTGFSGLGYRHFGQKLTPNVGNTLKFRYNELYVPVGFLTDYSVNSWFAMGVDFTWMPQVYPTVAIVPLKGSRWILTNQLANFFVNVPMNFTLTKNKRFKLMVDPFYERWQDGHSTAETQTGVSLGLPGNTYNFWGVNLNFLYCF